MMPEATFDRVPCRARPTASDAAPSTAMIEVVCTPSRCSTAIMPMMNTTTRTT